VKIQVNKQEESKAAFYRYVLNEHFPCMMAQSVFSTQKVDFYAYADFGSTVNAPQILSDLNEYIRQYDFSSNDFFTFVAAFPDCEELTEEEFERRLWKQLQALHEADESAWDKDVSHDAEDQNFSFSLCGKAFFIVGVHPDSSRKSRQSPFPALVFNLHFQFQRLREMGVYTTIRDKIRERDIALQGNVNPMLKDFGEESEARQYSGRAVKAEWKCPFHYKRGDK
jgi:uncharacterized protein